MKEQVSSPWRRAFGRLLFVLLGVALGVTILYVVAANKGPDLQSWHKVKLEQELELKELPGDFGLDDYLALEDRLLSELAAELGPQPDGSTRYSRFRLDSPTYPESLPVNWNRTFEMEVESPAGGALLLHGLTDAPYSLRSTGKILADHGFYALGLRLPGHGTAPGALRHSSWRHWQTAVRMGAAAVADRLGPSQPFVVVGYSNGAALALDYTLEALDNPELRKPDRLVFLSPALSVTSLASLARWQVLLSRLPFLEKLAWTSVTPEFDPFKYNSFPLNGGAQIHALTTRLESRLSALQNQGRMGELPPVLTIQSVVDATVPPVSSLSRLYGRVEDGGDELVLFDINRMAHGRGLLSPGVDALIETIEPGQLLAFDVTLVTNHDPESRQLTARTRRAGEHVVEDEALDLSWPNGVYSLSHVAIPFPPDDPVYGIVDHNRPPFPFGAVELRGERGVLMIPTSLLMRLRYNPFFPYLGRRIVEFLP